MKRTPFLITILLFITTVAGIWYYQSIREIKVSPWNLISDNAAFVIELKSLQSSMGALKTIPPLERIVASANSFSKLLKIKAFSDRKILISGHPIRRDDFDFVVYTDVGTELQVSILKELEQFFSKPYSWSKRSYNGQDIFEVHLNSKFFFSLAAMEGILVGSNSSFLLEGVIRLNTGGDKKIFRSTNANLFRLPSMQSDEGDIYINLDNFDDYIQTFLLPNEVKGNSIALGVGSIADLKFSKNQVLLNGFVTDSDSSLLSLFRYQRPQIFDLESLISNKVAALAHYGFSDPQNWFEQQNTQLNNSAHKTIDSLDNELKAISVDIESVRKSVGNQFANAFISQSGTSVVNILSLKKPSGTTTIFDELASKISESRRDSLYVESYAGYEIKLIDQKNFLYRLLYPLAYPTERSFFARLGESILFAEDVELIKQFIDDVESENTWGKSVEWNKYLGSSQKESSVNLFIDGKLVQFLLKAKLNAKWKPFFDTTSFMGIDKGSIQISRLDENYYLNSSFQFFANVNTKNTNRNLTKIAYDFGSKVTLRPSVVRSHVSKEIELIVQDTLNNLYFLTKDLKVQWKKAQPSPVLNNIEVVDYFKNGKLQYLTTSFSSINVIDRLGRNVEPFPKLIEKSTLKYSRVVDYDKSRNYRFLMTDEKGALYLTDKNGTLLEGWNPRVLGGAMIESARHYRILGRDYFIALQNDGVVQLLNRRGESVKGFPQSLSLRPSGGYYFSIGTLTTTTVSAVSQDGLLVQLGLDGQLKKREVLLKRTASSIFSLVKSKDDKSFVIIRIDSDKVGVLNADGVLEFEFENPGSTLWEVSYIENRLKEKMFCFYDKQQNFSYIYDNAGKIMNNQPMESTLMPTLYFNENDKSLSIYNVNESEVSLIKLKD